MFDAVQTKYCDFTNLLRRSDVFGSRLSCPPFRNKDLYYRKNAMEKKYLVNYWFFCFVEAVCAVAMVPIQMVAFGKCQQHFYRHTPQKCFNFHV